MGGVSTIVSIMDLIMFDAQRQGRLSFYMVRDCTLDQDIASLVNLTVGRYRLERKA